MATPRAIEPEPPAVRPTPAEAYRQAIAFARSHYENFPVASRLLPRDLVPHVAAVYGFARRADDFADEPAFEGRRLELLDRFEAWLEQAAAGRPPADPTFVALAETLRVKRLPLQPFRDLLTAFRRDVSRRRHPDFAELRDYCRHSAEPVGRIVLLLFGYRDEETFARSDEVCTALQLANFWQDVAVDLEKDRIYLPQDDMARFGVAEADLSRRPAPESFRRLLAFEVGRTRELFDSGWAVTRRVSGLLRIELRLTILGGLGVLDRIARLGFDTLTSRPALGRRDWVGLVPRALLGLRPGGHGR